MRTLNLNCWSLMTRRTLCAEQGSLKRRQMYGASGAKPSLFSWSSKLMIIFRCAGVGHFGRPRLSFARRFPARRAMAFRNPDSDRPSRLAAPRIESPFVLKLRAAFTIAGTIFILRSPYVRNDPWASGGLWCALLFVSTYSRGQRNCTATVVKKTMKMKHFHTKFSYVRNDRLWCALLL